MKSVVVLVDRHPRSKRLSEALRDGAARMGWRVDITEEQHLKPRADLCTAYGWLPHRATLQSYRDAGLDYVHVDLGFWNRKRSNGDYNGLHKTSLNDRHPTSYFRRQRNAARIEGAPKVLPWRQKGGHIIVAGLSAKGAASVGLSELAWETAIIAALRRITKRPIVYRPKPSWRDARPMTGCGYSPPAETIDEALRGAWALVTLYSNAAIDALAAGIPVYAERGVASALSMPSIDCIEAPPEVSEEQRQQFLADVGYCHWSRTEIAAGEMFAQFRDDGLIAA